MTWIVTASGRHFDYVNPAPDQIDIQDIALALSREARFNGHTRDFYSVAQHSVLASRIVPDELALEALLHDATEAYMRDIPSPLKALLRDYKVIEARVDAVIREKFGLPRAMSAEVKDADLILLGTERRDLRGPDGTTWECLEGVPLLEDTIEAWGPDQAHAWFLHAFVALGGFL